MPGWWYVGATTEAAAIDVMSLDEKTWRKSHADENLTSTGLRYRPI